MNFVVLLAVFAALISGSMAGLDNCAIDIIFMVDMSNSIPNGEVSSVRNYVQGVVNMFDLSAEATHVSIVQFNTKVTTHVINEYNELTLNAAIAAIDKAPSKGLGATCTAGVYERARAILGVDTSGVVDSATTILREDIPAYVFLITDGVPTRFPKETDMCSEDCRCRGGTGAYQTGDTIRPARAEASYLKMINDAPANAGKYDVSLFGVSVGGANDVNMADLTDEFMAIASAGDLADKIEVTALELCKDTPVPTSTPTTTEPTPMPTMEPTTASPTPGVTIKNIEKANIYFVLDKSASINDYAAQCEALEDEASLMNLEAGDTGFDCWQLFANFVENTITLVQEEIRGKNNVPDDEPALLDWDNNGGLQVDVSAFTCSYNQKVPVTSQYVTLTNNKAEFKAGMDKMRNDPIPDKAGTCPGQALERVLAKVEAQYDEQFDDDRFHFVIVVTDGIFWDGNRAPLTMDALRERFAVTYGVSIFGDKKDLTKRERELQKEQLALLTDNEDNAFLLEGFKLTKVAEKIGKDFGNPALVPPSNLPAYCGYGDASDYLDDEKEETIYEQHGDHVVLDAVATLKKACKLNKSHRETCKYNKKNSECRDR